MKFSRILIAAVTGIALSMSVQAAERGHERGGQDRGKMRGPGAPGMQVIHHLKRALHGLDLTEDQKANIKADMQGFRETLKPLAMEMKESKGALRELVMSESYDESTAAELAAQQGELSGQIALTVSNAVANVMAQLTPDQRAELEAKRAHRQDHREQRKEMRQARRQKRDAS